MSAPLSPIRELITQSWTHYAKQWNAMMEVSLWLLAFPLLMLVSAFTIAVWRFDIGQWTVIILSIFDVLFTAWIMVRLMLLALAHDKKERQSIIKNPFLGWDLYPAYLWISILGNITIIAASLLFIFPGIWLAVLFAFSSFVLVDQNLRGKDALAASAKLVKGRWWQVLWRIILPALFYFTLISIGLLAIGMVIQLFVGPDTFSALSSQLTSQTIQPLERLKLDAVIVLFNRIPKAIFLPLIVTTLGHLYRELKR